VHERLGVLRLEEESEKQAARTEITHESGRGVEAPALFMLPGSLSFREDPFSAIRRIRVPYGTLCSYRISAEYVAFCAGGEAT
jgi:hypothetical protein